MHIDTVIQNGTVVTAEAPFPATIAIDQGRISAVLPPGWPEGLTASETIDAAGCYVLPGAIDGHVHLHMPTQVGYTADDWATGTAAAALGGTTTLIDFVETHPHESLTEALDKRLAETKAAVIDFRLHMTLQPDEHPHPATGIPTRISERRIAEIRTAYEAGCTSFKMYQAYPGFQVGDADLLRALFAIAEVDGLACIHSENGDVVEILRQRAGPRPEAIWHARTRPPRNEHESVTRAVLCAELSHARMLIFHIGCAEAAQVVADAKLRGVAHVFGETCPQYLVLNDEALRRADGHKWICAPPLREADDQQAMWQMLGSRALDIVSTDHCPFTLAQKAHGLADFRKTPGGVPGIETRLGLLHQFGVRQGRLSLQDWVRVCCTRPAEIHRLQRKGRLAPGFDADVVIFDPQQPKSLAPTELHSAIDWSAYDGLTCQGWPRHVLVRGQSVVRDGKLEELRN